MKNPTTPITLALAATVFAVGVTWFSACGGGGSGERSTRINGNMAGGQALRPPQSSNGSDFAWRLLSPIGTAWAQGGGVEVCLQGTEICTLTNEDGSFSLPVEGDLVTPCLTFTGQDFIADLCLPFDVPRGAVVTLNNITCNTSNGTCEADDIDVDESDASEPSEEVSDEDFPSEPSPDEPSEPSPSDPSPDDSDEPSPDEPSPDEPSSDD